MPTLKFLDDLNTSVLDVNAGTGSGLSKYLRDGVVKFMALRPLVKSLNKLLVDAPTDPVTLEFALPDPVKVGDAGDLMLDAGVHATIGVHQPDELLFPADDLRDAITVPSGTSYVSMGLAPRVKAGLEGERGPLTFGFSAGATLGLRFFQPFDTAGTSPTLAQALSQTVEHAVIPADVDDLASLPLGAFVSVEGDGELHLSGSMEMASVTNPLATPGLPVIGSASISAGASVSVGADWRANGAFEIRVTKVADSRVRLAYFRRAGSEISIEAAASVGVSAKIGDSDAIKMLLSAISSDPEADLVQLVNAGLSDEQIEALQKAVAASVDRSLRIATEMQFSSVRRGEALFAYDIDISALTPGAADAVRGALRGRLTEINKAAKAETGSIRLVQTGILSRRDRKVTWRINLFGIVNVHGIAELLRKGTLSYDAITGTLNAADEIASQRILVKTRPFESDGEKVRKLVFESMIITAAYHASRVTSGLALKCSASYFEGRQKTTTADLRADYNAVIGLGLSDIGDRDRRLGVEHDFGPSTFLVECTFDQNASDALFIGPQGPFPREYYERVGRDAMLALIPPDDAERAHRRAAVESEASWKSLKDTGPAAARVDLARRFGDIRAGHIISDYLVIRWWSDAMADAAKALVAMRQFLAGRSAQSLSADPEFAKRRGKLEKELADVVKESKAQFGDPWGILALDAAARRVAAVQATIVSPKVTAIYNTRELPVSRSVVAIETVSRGGPPAEARREKRPFTADERELLRKHTINLRLGALSTDGEFSTGEADVQRLFSELIPAEIEARKASGQKARLLFYAHGGLTEEREGLEPVLFRLRFWRQNNVYPVSFVWETGLQETVTDLLKRLTGTRDVAARGVGEDLADAVIEVAGRQPGKQIWGQMKRTAELSVLDGGGGVLVAKQTRDLWNAHHADLEIHAVGHSAGSIFHAYFLPALIGQRPGSGAPPIRVKTLHFLAPACTSALFSSKLKDLVGADKGIERLTMYTMNKSLEQEDTAGPYRKSLLYLVSRAFEVEQPAAILGLEDSLRQDSKLIRFFGLGGNQKQADLLFSKSAPDAPLNARTTSSTHGGFDNDASTMNSVIRRVLNVPDQTSIVEYFEERIEETREAVSDVVAASMDPLGAPAVTSSALAAPAVDKKSPSPLIAEAVPSRTGARRALCVGIDKYGPPYDLAGCVNDATNWARSLQNLQFDVTLMKDQAATRSGILDAFGALVRGAQPGDVIVFQYAGHGTQVDDLDSDEDDSLDEAFCPVDFAQGRLMIDDDIRAVVGALKPGVNLTCFIDCCHSGSITRALVPGARPGVIPPGSRARYIPYSKEISNRHREFRKSGAGPAGAAGTRAVTAASLKEVSFSACQPHEVAYENAGAGQFTTRALSVLGSGGAVTNAAFMEQVIAAFGQNAAQHPYLDCSEESKARALLRPLLAAAAQL